MTQFKIEEIRFPAPASFDAGSAIAALELWGEDAFPGISQARLTVWHDDTDAAISADEWFKNGVMLVNCGASDFDHHPHGHHAGECAFTLVLSRLGLRYTSLLQEWVRYVLWDDTRSLQTQKGRPQRQEGAFALARTFKDMQYYQPTGDRDFDDLRKVELAQKAIAWLTQALETEMNKQDRFWNEGSEAYQRSERIDVPGYRGEQWRLVIGENDVRSFAAFARSQQGCGAHVVIQQLSTGNVRITCRNPGKFAFCFASLAGKIRIQEQKSRGVLKPIVTHSKLQCEGAMPEVPNWYYLVSEGSAGNEMLLNGSDSHADVEPTVIPLEDIVRITAEWLSSPECTRLKQRK